MKRLDGNWETILGQPGPNLRPCLFLDRDGVVIEERDYLSDPDQVVVLKGVAETVQAARAHGWAVAIVTNQSGIGRGYFDWDAYAAAETRVLESLASMGVTVDIVLACPHHPNGGKAPYNVDNDWRKPRPGMLYAARDYLNLDLGMSAFVGDKCSDIEAAIAAQLAVAIHVLTGHGPAERSGLGQINLNTTRLLEADSIADLPGLLFGA